MSCTRSWNQELLNALECGTEGTQVDAHERSTRQYKRLPCAGNQRSGMPASVSGIGLCGLSAHQEGVPVPGTISQVSTMRPSRARSHKSTEALSHQSLREACASPVPPHRPCPQNSDASDNAKAHTWCCRPVWLLAFMAPERCRGGLRQKMIILPKTLLLAATSC